MRWILRIILRLSIVLSGIVPVMSMAADVDEQREVAAKFIRSYFQSDLKVLIQTLPDNGIALFGPYPFRGRVRWCCQPKVDDNQALLEFTADTRDNKLYEHGAILFKREEEKWYVRQVLFYDNIPRIFNLPTKSVTDRDKAYEPTVKTLGEAFMAAWENNDEKKMLALWFNWPAKPRDPVAGLSVSQINLTPMSTIWGDPYIKYSAKMTYKWGILSYSMTVKGGLMLVEDHGKWRVRGNTLVLDF